MTQKMAWEEIRKQFPDKFVLLDHCVEQQIDDTHSEIVSGEVILVASDGQEVFDEFERRGKPSDMTYANTQWPKIEIVEIFAPGLRFMNLLD